MVVWYKLKLVELVHIVGDIAERCVGMQLVFVVRNMLSIHKFHVVLSLDVADVGVVVDIFHRLLFAVLVEELDIVQQ